MRQVITIEPGGIMSGLQVKPGKGLDLTKFGPASVQRASEICWDEMAQKWFVRLTDRHAEFVIKCLSDYTVSGIDYELIVGHMPGQPHTVDNNDVLLFDNYDEAVAAEIEFLDAARLKSLLS